MYGGEIHSIHEKPIFKRKVKSTMSKAKNKKNIVIAVAMVMVLAIAGISAYFTATDSDTNKFTIGNVVIDQTEPHFPETPPTEVVPNQEISKDPQVENKGKNDAYIFTVVAVPKKVVKVAKVDGSSPAVGDGALPAIDSVEQMTQIFQLNATEHGTKTMAATNINSALIGKTSNGVTADTTKGITAAMPTKSAFTTAQPALEVSNANSWTGVDSWNDNWYLLDVNNTLSNNDNAQGADALSTYLNDYNVYVFAYGSNSAMTRVAGTHDGATGGRTEPLFASVTMANIINVNDMITGEDTIDYDAGIELTMPQMLVKSFAIQADNIKSNGADPAAEIAPAEVWKVLNNQDGAYKAVADELTDLDAENSAWKARAVDSRN